VQRWLDFYAGWTMPSEKATRRLWDVFRGSGDPARDDPPNRREPRAYQSFADSRGASQSDEKLEAIRLPKNLAGKSVLDLGCNEGFFAAEAQRRGAARVVGIDIRPEFIERARHRNPDIEFRAQSWDELPEGIFDFVLLLSSLHYERQPRTLLNRIHASLADDGVLILECGVVKAAGSETRWVQRKVGAVQYPTWEMLLHRYLENFSVRYIGRSVDQAGDPIPRHVFHCRKHRAIVLLIGGAGDLGKTQLARELATKTATVVRIDTIIESLKKAPLTNTPLLQCVHSLRDAGVTSVRRMIDQLLAEGHSDEFADLVFRHIPLDERLVIVEGYGLDDEVLVGLNQRLSKRCVVWRAQRLLAESPEP
jgi:SAM-dependent methyltransferase